MTRDCDQLLGDVSTVLWRERRLLELLLFKLEEEELLLGAERTRWLARASREVEIALEEIRAVELERAVAVAGALSELGLDPAATLAAMADRLPTPWGEIFTQHRDALVAMTEEIRAVADRSRHLLVRGQQATSDALIWLLGGEEERPGVGGDAFVVSL